MNNKFETYKKNFKGDIDFLIGQINQDKLKDEEIKNFSSKWKENNNKIQSEFKNDIIEYSKKLKQNVPFNISIEESDLEEIKVNFEYWDNKHIIMHGIAFGAEAIGGAISAAATATVTVPGIGLAIGAGIMIHLSICYAKYVSNKSKEKDKIKTKCFELFRFIFG